MGAEVKKGSSKDEEREKVRVRRKRMGQSLRWRRWRRQRMNMEIRECKMIEYSDLFFARSLKGGKAVGLSALEFGGKQWQRISMTSGKVRAVELSVVCVCVLQLMPLVCVCAAFDAALA